MRTSRIVAALLVAALVLAACAGDGQGSSGDVGEVDLAGTLSPDDAAAAAEAVNAFGFDLHRGVAEAGANTVTSPLSASVLLAMVAAGAGGQTADEMVDVLRLEEPRDRRYAALLADLTADLDVTLSVANALWAREDYPFEPDYLEFTREYFGATLEEADLGSQETADEIDEWVTDRTDGLIEELAEDLGLPSGNAVLVLVNAVYFLGTWTTSFDEDDTRDAAFHLADGSTVEVPTMHLTEGPTLRTASGDGFRMVRLPYGEDERFGMEVLLPDEDVALDELLEGLDADTWRSTVEQLEETDLGQLALPRFELEWDAELNDVLAGLGMGSAFGGGDFTPMSAENPYLDTVVQKTYLRVDEQGTEAAAVTGGVMAESAGPPPFLVDRPFAFTVSDRDTGTIVFLGSVHDPRG